jgi:hypothetical protein
MNVNKWRRSQFGIHGRANLMGRKHPLQSIPATHGASIARR